MKMARDAFVDYTLLQTCSLGGLKSAVHENRSAQCWHCVSDDGRTCSRREVSRAHQRPLGQW